MVMHNSYDFPQESLKSRRFEAAVSVSAKLFLEKGIDAVKMTDIANETGIGVATLYRYFGTKTRITIAAMTYLWNDMNKMFSGIFESEVFMRQPGIKQLSDLMRMAMVFYNAHRDFMKLLGEFDLFLIRENVSKSMFRRMNRHIIALMKRAGSGTEPSMIPPAWTRKIPLMSSSEATDRLLRSIRQRSTEKRFLSLETGQQTALFLFLSPLLKRSYWCTRLRARDPLCPWLKSTSRQRSFICTVQTPS